MDTAIAGKGPLARGPFGSIENPVSMMEHEHDSAGAALRVMKNASNGYVAPPNACVSYQTLYKALAAFEADLHHSEYCLRSRSCVDSTKNFTACITTTTENGERGWTRTIDPCLKRALLYQLSYAPIFSTQAVAEDAEA